MRILMMLRDDFYEANPIFIEEAKQLGEVRLLYPDKGINKQELLKAVADVDIIVVAVVKIDRDVINAAKRLKYVIKYGAGYDNIDVEYADQKGIAVTNAPGQNAESAADHAFALMLSAARNIPKKDVQIKNGGWGLSMGSEVFNKRLGIIGFGAIGQAIARRALGFDMDVISFANYKNLQAAEQWNVSFVELEELLSSSDYVILATSLTEKNKEMINKETLHLMKPTAYLINIARGGLINEQDLTEALRSHQIRGAALDVFATEPSSNDLTLLENVVATPHIGGATFESISRIGNVTIDNIKRFIAEEELVYVVNSYNRSGNAFI